MPAADWTTDDWDDSDVFVAFATNLKTTRLNAKLSQNQLANIIGYSRIAISNMEVAATDPTSKRKQGATLPTLARLCWALKTTPDKLLRRVER